MTADNDMEARNKVFDLIKDIKFAMMVTQDREGRMYSRPMAAQQKDSTDSRNELWYFTSKDSPKVAEIKADSSMLVSYSDPASNNYVSLSGTAQITDDRNKIDELWSDALSVWFPQGKSDPNICLIKFKPETAEYWDAPSSKFVHAYGYVKAKLTGEPPEAGENKTVRLAS
ncbi:MAG: hypothetical protein DI586_00300 [Micavibrio aeruginosavorus]|uniref:General stress protein FMN-binding split barrel domain-containing protein n=1 Tax=Micavibrio aeruginosavorus TaxID=349221 RepID=A0A2W5FNG9_9BACT|nr:MAG: hypothetical protein DI586_00300 [Micavibrio aeruginosavorus]